MTDRMDEETERLIGALRIAAFNHSPIHIHEARDALRLRIAQLISEARAEGAQEAREQDGNWGRGLIRGGADDR